MTTFEIAGVCIATLVAGFIKGGAGMGAGIFLQPTLTLLTNPILALGISGPILMFTDAGSLLAYWKKWAPTKILFPLFTGCFLGTVIGIFCLPYISASLLKLVVGICGLVFVFVKFFKLDKKTSQTDPALFMLMAMTALGGFFNTVANAGGIFFAWCCLRLRLSPVIFVATLVIVICFQSLFKVSGYLLVETLTWQQFMACFLLLPFALFGAWLGSRFNKKLDQATFNKLILAIIFMVSSTTLITYIKSL